MKLAAASIVMSAVLTGGVAHAFVEDASDVAQQTNLKPPLSLRLRDTQSLRQNGEDSVHFLGKVALPQSRSLTHSARPVVDQVTTYFEQSLGIREGLELRAEGVPSRNDQARVTFVQTVRGVPVVGTYALAQVRDGFLQYAQAVLVTPPKLSTVPTVDADVARRAALADTESFAKSADLQSTPADLVIVYVGMEPRLAWRVELTTQVPYASWSVFVDAQSGAALMRHKTSLNAVRGTVYGEYEPACQGDKTERVAVPHAAWAPGEFTDGDGAFESTKAVQNASVSLKGRYFSIVGFGGAKKSWASPLLPAPADNEITLDEVSLGMIDPYIHANNVRSWARLRLNGMNGDTVDQTMAWTEKSTPVLTNITLMTCNAVYMPMMGGLLAFFGGKEGQCNNAAQIAKVVYHEYGHGVHHHLAGSTTFDPQISEGAGDYVASTITDNPDMTGLTGCDETLPTGNKNVQRTCANHYTYCADGTKCDTSTKDEPHITAPVVCGAFWDLREELKGRYGVEDGVEKADQLFLKFLSVSTNMDAAYTAAIASDDDDDGDPSNGTTHSCEINNAFLGARNGLPHFPDAVGQKVPCSHR